MKAIARRSVADSIGDVLTAAGLLASPHLALACLRQGGTIAAVVESSARRFGDATALSDREGRLGYRGLAGMVEAVSSTLPSAARIGVVCGDQRWLLIAVAAIVRAGSDAVLIGPATGAAELAAVTADVALVLRDADVAARTVGAGASPRGRGRIVLLSSGTTGAPQPTHRPALGGRQTLTAASLIAHTGLRRGEPVLVLPPLHHGHGLSLAIACLAAGAPIVLRDEGSVVELIDREAVGIVSAVPAQLARLAEQLDSRPLPRLRRIVSGSARLSPSLAARLREHAEVVDFYGSTGTGTLTASLVAGTVGHPVAGVTIRIVDASGHTLDRGVEGRVHARSPLGSGPTGDRGYLDSQGRLVITGRDDGLVRVGGEHASTAEVEDFLLAQPDVRDAHVFAVPDERLGSVLIAHVVTSATPEDLQARVAAHLSLHKVPRIELVHTIERTPTGKAKIRNY